MGSPIQHRHHRAVISFDGALTWEAAIGFVEALDVAVDVYFYSHVEVLIHSEGGNLRAWRHMVNALTFRRQQGVRFRTRVLNEASSAAAILASLGDERVAASGSWFLYHLPRTPAPQGLTTMEAGEMITSLDRLGEFLVDLLVTWAFRSSRPSQDGADLALPEDRSVLQRLWPLIRHPRSSSSPPRALSRLSRAASRTVDEALRKGNRKALTAVYRAVFEIGERISAPLARTLCLIDRVADRDAPEVDVSDLTPGFTIPEWSALYRPHGDVPRQALVRHTLVLGETGSGKTASCILPVMAAMTRAPRDALSAALIIDPKQELAPILAELAPERLRHLHAETFTVNMMSNPRWSIEADIKGGRWSSAALRVLARVASFVPSSPARILMQRASSDSNSDFFDREGASLLAAVVGFILMVLHSPALTGPYAWPVLPSGVRYWVRELRERAQGTDSERGPNVLALAAWALDGPLVSPPLEEDSPWLFSGLARVALQKLASTPSEGRDLLRRIIGYWRPMADIERQFGGVRAVASAICTDFAAPRVARTLYFGCEAGFVDANDEGVDFPRAVACDGGGPLVLFQPARDGLDNLVAIALKAAFFEAVLDDPRRIAGSDSLPLVGYIADEFHRFVTSDPVHGEQSFLDTCRSFGAFCLLACQSVASIEHALAHGSGNSTANATAVSILWNNTASKLVFRSTDERTAELVSGLCPRRPDLDSVADVRPLATLSPGECYAALADGRFERRQLTPFSNSHSQEHGHDDNA